MKIFRPVNPATAADDCRGTHLGNGNNCQACTRAPATTAHQGDRLCSGCATTARVQDAAN